VKVGNACIDLYSRPSRDSPGRWRSRPPAAVGRLRRQVVAENRGLERRHPADM